MEEILMDLQLKKDKEERMLKEDHRKSRWEKREDKKE